MMRFDGRFTAQRCQGQQGKQAGGEQAAVGIHDVMVAALPRWRDGGQVESRKMSQFCAIAPDWSDCEAHRCRDIASISPNTPVNRCRAAGAAASIAWSPNHEERP